MSWPLACSSSLVKRFLCMGASLLMLVHSSGSKISPKQFKFCPLSVNKTLLPRFTKAEYTFNLHNIARLKTHVSATVEEILDGRIQIIHCDLSIPLNIAVSLLSTDGLSAVFGYSVQSGPLEYGFFWTSLVPQFDQGTRVRFKITASDGRTSNSAIVVFKDSTVQFCIPKYKDSQENVLATIACRYPGIETTIIYTEVFESDIYDYIIVGKEGDILAKKEFEYLDAGIYKFKVLVQFNVQSVGVFDSIVAVYIEKVPTATTTALDASTTTDPAANPQSNSATMQTVTSQQQTTHTVRPQQHTTQSIPSQYQTTQTVTSQQPTIQTLTSQQPTIQTVTSQQPTIQTLTSQQPTIQTVTSLTLKTTTPLVTSSRFTKTVTAPTTSSVVMGSREMLVIAIFTVIAVCVVTSLLCCCKVCCTCFNGDMDQSGSSNAGERGVERIEMGTHIYSRALQKKVDG